MAKAACHRACADILAGSGVTFSWARLFYLYGPHEHEARLAPSVARALLRGEVAACSSGLAVRDYMHVADVGAGLAALALSSVEGAVNVASGQGTTIAHLAQVLADLVGRPDLLHLGALPDRTDEPPRITADVKRLSQEVGFQPRFDLRSGLADALAYWRSQI
jgi:nucleoside-diphosphate-sugar epimerase